MRTSGRRMNSAKRRCARECCMHAAEFRMLQMSEWPQAEPFWPLPLQVEQYKDTVLGGISGASEGGIKGAISGAIEGGEWEEAGKALAVAEGFEMGGLDGAVNATGECAKEATLEQFDSEVGGLGKALAAAEGFEMGGLDGASLSA